MADKESPAQQEQKRGRVVYRRSLSESERGEAIIRLGSSLRRVSPTLVPLLASFTILLILVFSLGRYSAGKLEQVSSQVVDMRQAHSTKVKLLQDLGGDLTKLDSEARARSTAEAGRQLKPPFAIRLNDARDQFMLHVSLLDNPTYSGSPKWRELKENLLAYAETTKDLGTYSENGFAQFKGAEAKINDLLAKDMPQEQEYITARSEQLQLDADRRIRLLTWIALAAGALVATGTVWEVQRRFHQMGRSLRIAGREQEFSRQTLEGMVSAVAAIDVRDRIMSANAPFSQLFPQLTVGTTIYDKSLPPNVLRMLGAATSSRVKKATYRGRWAYGEHEGALADRSFDVYSSPLKIDAEAGQIVTLVDVTEAAQAEAELRQSESLAAVGQASAQVAHEIKNPLGSIRLGVSMLRDSITDRDALNTIDLVERGIDHLNKLVVDVTQFSRQRALAVSEIELNELIDSSIELVSDRIREKKVSVERRFSSGPISGEWDEHQLRQVLLNLLANAIDASREDSPVVVSTESIRAEGGNGAGRGHTDGKALARIAITDHGGGMDEKTRARIFEPFFTTKKRGTGLGLAIAKQIVDQHQGSIAVFSEPGKGTSITIDLPLKIGEG
jgi:signal transduction histidine kinase